MYVECPVCEKKIEPSQAVHTLVESDEQTLYFCSERCFEKLAVDPELFTTEDSLEEARAARR